MCDEAVDSCVAALEFIPDCLVTRKILEKLDNALHANNDILFYNEDFKKVIFLALQGHIVAADIDKIKLGKDNNFYAIIHVRLLVWRSNFEKRKALGGIFVCQKMRKKKWKQFLLSNAFSAHQ